MALVGRHVLLQYDVGGPILWHEPLVLEHVQQDLYIVATPDAVYAEDLGLLNNDVRTILERPAPGVVPPGMQRARLYEPPWTQQELDVTKEGELLTRSVEQDKGEVFWPLPQLVQLGQPQW